MLVVTATVAATLVIVVELDDAATGDDDGTAADEPGRFGDDGLTICAEGIGAASAAESAAEETLIAALAEVFTDARWSDVVTVDRKPEESVVRGCASEPVALQSGVTVVDRGAKGVLLEGMPIVDERDTTTDIRVYVLTPAAMAQTFGEERQAVLTSEAWIVNGDQAMGVNQALYLSSHVVGDLVLISERLRHATGLWEPEW